MIEGASEYDISELTEKDYDIEEEEEIKKEKEVKKTFGNKRAQDYLSDKYVSKLHSVI